MAKLGWGGTVRKGFLEEEPYGLGGHVEAEQV